MGTGVPQDDYTPHAEADWSRVSGFPSIKSDDLRLEMKLKMVAISKSNSIQLSF